MKQSVLLIDISNSWTKVGVGYGKKVTKLTSIKTNSLSAKQLKTWVSKFQVSHTVISSVVPTQSLAIKRCLPKLSYTFLTSSLPLPLKILYPKPHTIGADRLANSLAAITRYPLPAVVIDFGTAVTFDIISKNKEYLGGVIAPGLNLMTDYLHEKTALLPKVTIRQPKRSIAKSTKEAMRVGAVTGYQGLISGLLNSIQKELKTTKLTVITTGGHAKLISKKMKQVSKVNPLLTLEGLYDAYLYQQTLS